MKYSLTVRLIVILGCIMGGLAGFNIWGGIRLQYPDKIFWGVGYLMMGGILIAGANWINKIEKDSSSVQNASKTGGDLEC